MKFPIGIASFLSASILPASAVVVAGASGGAGTTNNTTRSQLESELSTSFPLYNNVIQYSDASGIYLGYDAVTRDVWIMTARHVTPASSVTIDGLTYNLQSSSTPGGDIRLERYSRGDLAVPSLPSVRFATSVPTSGSQIIMTGFGQSRTEVAATIPSGSDAGSIAVTGGSTPGYNWAGPNIGRWGTNNIEAEFPNSLESTGPVSGVTGTFSIGGVDSIGFTTDFDQPGTGQWLSSNEAQGSLGDSGGAAFVFQGGEWRLAGINSAVAGFDGQTGSTSAFGNLTIITSVPSYSSAINSAIGVALIPELSSAMLVVLSGLTLCLRRRR